MTVKTDFSIGNSYKENIDKTESRSQGKISACGCDINHNSGEYISSNYKAKRIYFCAESCKEEFLEDPEAFLASDHFTLEFELLEEEVDFQNKV